VPLEQANFKDSKDFNLESVCSTKMQILLLACHPEQAMDGGQAEKRGWQNQKNLSSVLHDR
jgi:phosphoribosylformylglycinamidine (FGAM) synthase-like amidotransferase family enzyme